MKGINEENVEEFYGRSNQKKYKKQQNEGWVNDTGVSGANQHSS